MPTIEQVDISQSAISGTVPPTLSTRLVVLRLSGSRVSGTLPNALSQLQRLKRLDASSLPGLSGSLEHINWSNMTRLRFVDIASTLISGSLPSGLLRLPGMEQITASHSRLSGKLEDVLSAAQLSRTLVLLDLRGNRVSGSVSAALGNCSSLKTVDLADNLISGALLAAAGRGSVARLELANNRVSALSLDLFRSPTLLSLGLVNNSITIPVDAPNCPARQSPAPLLRSLRLSGNRFFAGGRAVPTEIQVFDCLVWSQLQELSIAGMELEPDDGRSLELPQQADSLTALYMSSTITKSSVELDFGEAGGLQQLRVLDVSRNIIRGGLRPPSPNLATLDASYTFADLCSSHALFESTATSLYLEGVPSVDITSARCERVRELLYMSTARREMGQSRGNVSCPMWRTQSAVLSMDIDVFGFLGCHCPSGTYWGTVLDEDVRQQRVRWRSEAELEAMLARRRWQCQPCPIVGGKGALECSTATGARRPHRLGGSLYPIYDGRFYADRWLLAYASSLLRCQHSEVCNAGNDGDYSCRHGHDPASLLCSACSPGFYRQSLLCEKCPASYKWLVPLSSVVAGLCFVLFLGLKNFHRPGLALSITFFWFQLVSVLERVNQVNSGDPSHEEASGSGFIGHLGAGLQALSGFRPFAWECVNDEAGFVSYTAVMFSLPVVVLGLGATAVGLSRLCVGTLRDTMRQRATVATLYVAHVMYFPVAHRVMQMFHCVQVEREDDVRFLYAAPWISCSGSTHRHLLASAVVLLVVYVLALPLLFLWLLRDEERAQLVPFFFASVRQEYRWWPLAVLQVRSLLFSVLLGSLSYGNLALPLCVFFVLLLALLLQVRFRPYVVPYDNALEALVLTAAIMLFLANMLAGMQVLYSQQGAKNVSAVLYIVVLVAVVVALARSRLAKCCKRKEARVSASVGLVQEQGSEELQYTQLATEVIPRRS